MPSAFKNRIYFACILKRKVLYYSCAQGTGKNFLITGFFKFYLNVSRLKYIEY